MWYQCPEDDQMLFWEMHHFVVYEIGGTAIGEIIDFNLIMSVHTRYWNRAPPFTSQAVWCQIPSLRIEYFGF